MEPKYIEISALNRYLKAKFDLDKYLNKVYLKGEISNYKNHTRGHLYFTLKDETSRISAVMFSSSAKNLKFNPADGTKVLITGRVAVYEATGAYQIYVETMEPDGVGNLHILYEELKKKLQSEGLFDQKYKKEIPKYPKKIGIITASTGAAIRDILSTIERRYPICETILFPSLVQGQKAKEDIVKNIELAQNYDLDLIICGRGGGSIEDMWAFNEEIVARAIFASKIPIISAVGHEIDFTIADFVADLRAPTPTGAAEMAVPNIIDVYKEINQFQIRTNESLRNILVINNKRLENIKDSYILKNPLRLYEIQEQKLDTIYEKINTIIQTKLDNNKLKFNNILNNKILQNPIKNNQEKEKELILHQEKATNYITNIIKNNEYKTNLIINSLELSNPLKILSKGFSIVKKDNKIIKNIKDIKIGDSINITLEKGNISATISEVNK